MLEKFIGWVSPSWAAERALARTRLNVLQRSYEAAQPSRRTANWRATTASGTVTAGSAIAKLRAQARYLVRNNPWVAKAITTIAANCVGSGIQATITAPDASAPGALESAKAMWKAWAETTACDFSGRLTFVGLQSLIMRTVAESGECLILKTTKRDAAMPLQLRVLEGDYIDAEKHTWPTIDQDGSFDFYGVRFDRDGRRIGIWLYDKHPTDIGANMVSKLVPDADVIHVFEVLRPGQERGVPMGVSGFIRVRDFDDYEDAELTRKKIAACMTAFVRKANSDALDADDTEDFEHFEPGSIQYLRPGEDVTFSTPPSAEGYEAYTRQQLRAIAAAYGITYEALTTDLSNVNFSSAKVGRDEMLKNMSHLQRDVLIPALSRVWSWFTEFLDLRNIPAEGLVAEWTVPRREMIDPVKEITGLVQAIRAGLMSQPEVLRQMGYDPEAVLAEQAEWLKKCGTLGIMLATDVAATSKPDSIAGDGLTSSNAA